MLQVLLQNRTQTEQNNPLKKRCMRVDTKLNSNVHVIKQCTHVIILSFYPRQMSHSQVFLVKVAKLMK